MITIDYAREHGLKPESIYSAGKALAENGVLPVVPESPFQKVQVASASIPAGSQWQIQLPNGTTVSSGGPIDAANLALVLKTAAAVS